ncbi:MAG TPA: hypothetical protein VJ696_01565 [Rhodanobacteraceae bacterium]|nr:hypothetical protein [Rhodanobacteraceae bacterium]
MWKSLRIGALVALVALCALKLAQHFAAGASAERLAAALGPSMRLGFSDVGGALDGRVVLESPRLEVLTGPAQGAVLRASRATIEPAGTFWLLRRVLAGDASVPPALDIRLEGGSFSHETTDRYASEGWFGPASLVPFESVGCDPVTMFSARDYARMGIAVRAREDDLRYTYDAAARTLRADLVSTAAPFSTVTAHLELSAFEPAAWFGNERAAKAERIEQLSLTWLDGGYLAQRNRFCAQLTGTDAAGYASRHIAAVKAFLDARGIVPGEDVAALYRKLVAEGGSAELSSLPEASFSPAALAEYAPDDALRRLNVTLRRNTAPPILLRLAFREPSANPDPFAALAIAADPPAPAPAELPATETVAMPEPAPPETPRGESLLLSSANAAVLPVELPPMPMPMPSSEVLAVATPPVSTEWTVVAHPTGDPREAAEAIPASAPPPPAGSTAALVWRAPTIERLAERAEIPSAYVPVPVSSIGAYRGTRVRLVTAGGKHVEGRVQAIEGSEVVMRVFRNGGSADLRIPAAAIRDVKVRRAAQD